MLYFLHNYELPAIENGNNNDRRDEDAYLDEAVQMIVEGIEMVAGQQNNLNQHEVPNEIQNSETDGNQVVNTIVNEFVNEEEQVAESQEPFDYMVHRIILFASDSSLLQIFRTCIRVILNYINSSDRRFLQLGQLPGQLPVNSINDSSTLPRDHSLDIISNTQLEGGSLLNLLGNEDSENTQRNNLDEDEVLITDNKNNTKTLLPDVCETEHESLQLIDYENCSVNQGTDILAQEEKTFEISAEIIGGGNETVDI